MSKDSNGVDFGNQEIIIGRSAIYASGSSLSCGVIARVTEKNVVMQDGSMVRKDKMFMLGTRWSIKK